MSQRGVQPGIGGLEHQGKRRTPEEIEADIEQTRSAISEDIQELREKLSAEHIKESAKESARGVLRDAKEGAQSAMRDVKESAYGMAQQVGGQARRAGNVTMRFTSDNAAPLALIGLGVGWLAWSLRKQRYGGESDISLRGSSYRLGESGEEATRGWSETGREYGEREYYGGASETAFEPVSTEGYGGVSESYGAGTAPYTGATAPYASGESSGLAQQGTFEGGGALERGKERAEDLAATARERAREVSQGAEQRLSRVGERLRDTRHRLGERASAYGRGARDRMQHVQGRTREVANENPLAFGAIALLTGIGIGMLLPTSRSERRLLGPTSQRFVGEAREAAQRVSRVARESAEDVKGRFESSVPSE